jgi:hypothetical protein
MCPREPIGTHTLILSLSHYITYPITLVLSRVDMRSHGGPDGPRRGGGDRPSVRVANWNEGYEKDMLKDYISSYLASRREVLSFGFLAGLPANTYKVTSAAGDHHRVTKLPAQMFLKKSELTNLVLTKI